MLFDNLPLPMPWYDGIGLQDRFRQNVAQDAIVTQLAPYDGLLPFQIRKPATSALPITWKVRCCAEGVGIQEYLDGYEDPEIVSFVPLIITTCLEPSSFSDPDNELSVYDYLIFRHELNFLITGSLGADGLAAGIYYMEMDFGVHGGGKWYSETFRVPEDKFSWHIPQSCNFPVFKWAHQSDLGKIHYHDDAITPFYNLLYLDSFITASEPTYEVKGDLDGVDEFHPTFEKLVVKYRVSCVVPDYIKIALYAMQIHDDKYLTTEKAIRKGEIKNVEVSSTLSTDGAHSFVEILFEQISLFTETGCNGSMSPPDGYELGSTPTLYSEFCEATGSIYLKITTALPTGIFGTLYKKVGGFYFSTIENYISRDDLLAGYVGMIDPGSGATEFKISFQTFSFVVGESTESTPVASC